MDASHPVAVPSLSGVITVQFMFDSLTLPWLDSFELCTTAALAFMDLGLLHFFSADPFVDYQVSESSPTGSLVQPEYPLR
jgi:hypothetical protein